MFGAPSNRRSGADAAGAARRGPGGRGVPVGLQLDLHRAGDAVALAIVERVDGLQAGERVVVADALEDLRGVVELGVAHPAVDVDHRLVVRERGGVQQRRGELLRGLVEVLVAGA